MNDLEFFMDSVTIIFVIFFVLFLIFYMHYYLSKVFNDPQEHTNNVCLFSFNAYLRSRIIYASKFETKVNLYPKYIIIERLKKQRVFKSNNISFSKYYFTNIMEIKIPDMIFSIRIELTKEQYLIMQKYLEIINTYDNEEDIIKHFKID